MDSHNECLLKSEIVKKLILKFSQIPHLRTLLADVDRNNSFNTSTDCLLFDYSHEKLDDETLELLIQLAEERGIKSKFMKMLQGDKINTTENRRVLHTALRLGQDEALVIDGVDIVKDVHVILDRIKGFSENVRSSKFLGFTGKSLKNFVSIGIGGSYLGTDFVYNSLKNHSEYEKLSNGMEIRFLANVCPIDFFRATKGLDFEQTLFIIISKTFTTAETMLNARNCKAWLINKYREKYPYLSNEDIKKAISHHFCAVSTNLIETDKFGIDQNNVFGFWDWVGGRYSVWSAVGALPLSLVFGYEVFADFLKGGRYIDKTIQECKSVKDNVPILLGLLGFYNTFICGLSTRAILPYSQALVKLPSHIQQLDMESNGKLVSIATNQFVDYECGPVVFGEAGTNGQHSFYQLIHQGRNIACEFIAHSKPQQDLQFNLEPVSNHEELMCNFFAQPDALAYGKFTDEELREVPKDLINHKTFKGDKSSISILLRELNAYSVGQLLAIYEHRVACEGFMYDVNSFDQWGVELGKVLAGDVRKVFSNINNFQKLTDNFNSATVHMMKYFLENKK